MEESRYSGFSCGGKADTRPKGKEVAGSKLYLSSSINAANRVDVKVKPKWNSTLNRRKKGKIMKKPKRALKGTWLIDLYRIG